MTTSPFLQPTARLHARQVCAALKPGWPARERQQQVRHGSGPAQGVRHFLVIRTIRGNSIMNMLKRLEGPHLRAWCPICCLQHKVLGTEATAPLLLALAVLQSLLHLHNIALCLTVRPVHERVCECRPSAHGRFNSQGVQRTHNHAIHRGFNFKSKRTLSKYPGVLESGVCSPNRCVKLQTQQAQLRAVSPDVLVAPEAHACH